METELRDLLREKAEEMLLEAGLPARVRHRARRHRRGYAVLAVGIAAGMLAGGVLGMCSIVAPDRGARPGGPAPTGVSGLEEPGPWPVWPHATLEDARRDQELADQGHEQVTWERDLWQVVERFIGEQGWGWDPLFVDPEPSTISPDEVGPVVVHIGDCEDVATEVCPHEATLVLQRLVRLDRTGVWSIITQTATGPGGADVEPSPRPVIPTPTRTGELSIPPSRSSHSSSSIDG